MNLNKALDKAYEGKSLKEVLDAPVAALSGVSDADAKNLEAAFGIKTIRDLGTNKYFVRAAAIAALESSEEQACGTAAIYIEGNTQGLPGEAASGLGDAYIRKYDANGSLLWARSIAEAGNNFVTAAACASAVNLGAVSIFVTDETHVVLNVNGYFQ